MMSSGTASLPLTISNLWPQCLAALQSWLTFPKNKNIDHCKGSATHHRLVLVAFMGPGTLVCLTIQHEQQSEEQTRALGTGWDGCCVEGAWCYTLRSACMDGNPLLPDAISPSMQQNQGLSLASFYTVFKEMIKSLNVDMRELEHGGNFPSPRDGGLILGDLLGSLAQLDLVGLVLGLF